MCAPLQCARSTQTHEFLKIVVVFISEAFLCFFSPKCSSLMQQPHKRQPSILFLLESLSIFQSLRIEFCFVSIDSCVPAMSVCLTQFLYSNYRFFFGWKNDDKLWNMSLVIEFSLSYILTQMYTLCKYIYVWSFFSSARNGVYNVHCSWQM